MMEKKLANFSNTELNKVELSNVNCKTITGSVKTHPGGLNGPCGNEPNPIEFPELHQLWVECKKLNENPGQSGTCVF
jgi:hypothetical protein